ncbi:adenylosuccinate synthase [Armatimonas rosea]|uniref:Adenylosuccinate synthetase n=2 Tax=Armatimonas rosea TaxID=685828 RepID=A0A7W9SUC3_ARMRO|nr:adenylosuccinate synthase [Armatimonas rosea]
MVDWATRELAASGRLPLIVRHSGGAQAAHAVLTPDGRAHTFQQLGSGSFVPGVRTYLSEHMLVNPLTLFWESELLRAVGVTDALSRLILHPDALVTTPWHMAANRYREQRRGAGRHGSCGLGIGETQAEALAVPDDALRVRDLLNPRTLPERLNRHRARKHAECPGLVMEAEDEEAEAWIALCQGLLGSATVADPGFLLRHLRNPAAATVFEGAQGVLLDEWRGFHPYTTWSTVTTENAYRLLEGSGAQVVSLGVIRGYATRHGAGPFPTEDAALTTTLPDDTNPENPWQGALRVGWPDLELLRYSLRVAGRVECLAVTCLDRMEAAGAEWKVGDGYENLTLSPGPWQDLGYQESLTESLRSARPLYKTWAGSAEAHAVALAAALERPLAVTSWGKTASDKRGVARALPWPCHWQT